MSLVSMLDWQAVFVGVKMQFGVFSVLAATGTGFIRVYEVGMMTAGRGRQWQYLLHLLVDSTSTGGWLN